MLSFVLGGCFCSCRTQYIPIESVKTEYNVRDSIRYDSIYQHDSVYLTVKGDKVYQYKYKYLYKYQYVNKKLDINHFFRLISSFFYNISK